MIKDCNQLGLDFSWTLERENACHISNLNSETGELRDAQVVMNYRLEKIEGFMSVQTWIWAIIGATLIGLVVKRTFTMFINGRVKK